MKPEDLEMQSRVFKYVWEVAWMLRSFLQGHIVFLRSLIRYNHSRLSYSLSLSFCASSLPVPSPRNRHHHLLTNDKRWKLRKYSKILRGSSKIFENIRTKPKKTWSEEFWRQASPLVAKVAQIMVFFSLFEYFRRIWSFLSESSNIFEVLGKFIGSPWQSERIEPATTTTTKKTTSVPLSIHRGDLILSSLMVESELSFCSSSSFPFHLQRRNDSLLLDGRE